MATYDAVDDEEGFLRECRRHVVCLLKRMQDSDGCSRMGLVARERNELTLRFWAALCLGAVLAERRAGVTLEGGGR